MKKRFKKFMALVMAATLLCSSMTVFAVEPATYTTAGATGTISGNGQLEDWVNKDVFKVVLPTVKLDDRAYSFVLDPQDLIKKTSGEAYESKTDNIDYANAKGLYFTNYDATGDATGMSRESDSMMAVNKGTVPVKLSLTASVTNLGTIGLSATEADLTSADATKTNIYLAIKASGEAVSGNAETPITSTGASTSFTLEAADNNAYEYKYNSSGNAYSYDLTASADAEDVTTSALFKRVSFNLTGACNMSESVNWASIKGKTTSVKVVWTLAKAGSFLSSESVSASSPSVTISYPDGATRVTSVSLKKPDGTVAALKSGTTYTLSGTTLGIATSIINAYRGGTVTVTLDNGATSTITIN